MRGVLRVGDATPGSVKWWPLKVADAFFLAALVVVLGALALRGLGWWRGDHGDLLDFIEGGRSVLIGRDIYADIPGVLRFNYPPFGAVVMIPLALMGLPLAFPLLTALSIGGYAVIVVAVARLAGLPPRLALLIGLGGLALEPVFRTVALGQVNLCLAALVVVDLFLLPQRFRGTLIGVAAGIKVTPALFGLIFLFRREWGSGVRCVGAFGLTVAVGWMLAPLSAPQYWLHFEWLQRFVADATVTQNQSLRALLVRATGSAVPEPLVTGAMVLVIVAGLVAVWRQSRAGADLAAVVGLAAVGLVVTPISWTHHWVWVVPGLILLAAAGKRVAVWGVGAVFYIAPMWFVVGGGPADPPLAASELVGGSAYLWVGLVAIVYLLLASPMVLPPPPQSQPAGVERSITAPPRHRV